MPPRVWSELLAAQQAAGKFVCVGLDSDVGLLPASVDHSHGPASAQFSFGRAIVDATKDVAGCYKPNSAFYEAQGSTGIHILGELINYIHNVAPTVPVILDAKRGDIGSTNDGYIKVIDTLGADAITISPYLGRVDGLQPFIERTDKGIIVLCRTSNKGAREFQDLPVMLTEAQLADLQGMNPLPGDLAIPTVMPLYQYVAYRVSRIWNGYGNCAVVAGATSPAELAVIRGIVGDMPLLIPGVGKQGGTVEEVVPAGRNSKGQGMIINNSRGIIFASNGEDFAEAARAATLKMHSDITAALAV